MAARRLAISRNDEVGKLSNAFNQFIEKVHLSVREIVEIVGVVTGNVVQAKHIGKDIMAGMKSIVGGEIHGYTEMLTEARDIAIQRLVQNAHDQGVDAVVGIRFTTSTIMDGVSEVIVFGTAVKLES